MIAKSFKQAIAPATSAAKSTAFGIILVSISGIYGVCSINDSHIVLKKKSVIIKTTTDEIASRGTVIGFLCSKSPNSSPLSAAEKVNPKKTPSEPEFNITPRISELTRHIAPQIGPSAKPQSEATTS